MDRWTELLYIVMRLEVKRSKIYRRYNPFCLSQLSNTWKTFPAYNFNSILLAFRRLIASHALAIAITHPLLFPPVVLSLYFSLQCHFFLFPFAPLLVQCFRERFVYFQHVGRSPVDNRILVHFESVFHSVKHTQTFIHRQAGQQQKDRHNFACFCT